MTASNISFLFVGSYASQGQSGLHICQFNISSGELTLLNSFSGIENPSFLAVHPNGRFLYAVSEVGIGSHGKNGAVWAFTIDPQTHALEKINQQSTQGDWPCHVTLDQNGRFLVASNYGSGNAALFPIQVDGSLGKMLTLLQHEGSGPNPHRQEGPHAHSAIFTPDNRFIIVADLGIDRLMMVRFDDQNGAVQKHQEIAAHPGAGPRHMVFHPNGRFLYVANELDNTVTRYDYDANNGSLTPLNTQSTVAKPNPESFVADIHLSADGTSLYISNRGDNSLATFEVKEDGHVSLKTTPSCGGNWPRNFALTANGRFALVANRRSNSVSVLRLEKGMMVDTAVHQLTLNEPSCIKFLP